MTTREAIEARIPQYMADYDGDEHASLDYFNAIRDLRLMLDLLATVEAERDEWKRKFFAEQKECVEFARHLNEQDATIVAAEARAEGLARAVREKALEIERHCPCGARPESLQTHAHVTGCPVAALLALDVQESS